MSSAEFTEWIAFFRARAKPEVPEVDRKLKLIFGRPAGGR